MTFRALIDHHANTRDLSSGHAQQQAVAELDKIMYLISDPELDQCYKNLIQSFELFEQQLNQVKIQTVDQLEQKEKVWLQKSSQWYQETLDLRISQTPGFINSFRNQRFKIGEDTEKLYISRVMRHSDWHHAGMIIHPGTEPFMQHMVASDPLYLVDESYELLEPVLNNYNEIYRRRLRTYVIEEAFGRDILAKLPNSQFGICLAYHYFDFRPVEMIEQYLVEIYQKLKPGGTLIMTLNDCERLAGLTLVEMNYACYNRATLIKNLAIRLNYTIEFFYHDNGPMSWIELRKPGELDSMRGGQTLAKIMPKPVANSK